MGKRIRACFNAFLKKITIELSEFICFNLYIDRKEKFYLLT